MVVVQGKTYCASVQNAFSELNQITETHYTAKINQQEVRIAVFAHPSTPDNKHNWGRSANTPYLMETVVPTLQKVCQELLGISIPKGENIMHPISGSPKSSRFTSSKDQAYDAIFEQFQAGLIQRFPPEVTYRKPRFEHSRTNRMRIYLDRISGSHYEICFRGGYTEFALHFESTPAKSLERRQAFDPHLQALTQKVGALVRSGRLENKGWMRVWYEQKREPIDQARIALYIEQYSRFIAGTFPILEKVYAG